MVEGLALELGLAVGAEDGVGVGVAPVLFAELFVDIGAFQTPQISFLPLLTQTNLTFGVSAKLPTLEQVPPILGAAAFAGATTKEDARKNMEIKIEDLRI